MWFGKQKIAEGEILTAPVLFFCSGAAAGHSSENLTALASVMGVSGNRVL